MTHKEIAESVEEILEMIKSSDDIWSLPYARTLSVFCGVGENEIIKDFKFEPNSELDSFIDHLMDLISSKSYNIIKELIKETLLENEKYEILNLMNI